MELTEGLKNVYGDKLEAVVLYGSSTGGDFHKGYSDHNVIVVLKELAPMVLARSTDLMAKWTKKGNPMPLFFTKGLIYDSADVFPIEFADIIGRHKLLYGADPFLDIRIDPRNLRHQTEHELRSKLLALQQSFVLLSKDRKEVMKLVLGSSSSFFAIFSGVIRLAGAEPEKGKKEVALQMAKLTGSDVSILIEILEVREGSRIWRKEEAMEKFEQYLTSIESVISYVDRI